MNRRMKLIYVSGKYTGTPEQVLANIRVSELASLKLLNLDWAVLTPHKNTSGYEKFEKQFPNLDYNFFMDIDVEMLRRCDAIFMLENWVDSRGAKIELDFAIENNIPVFYESDGFPAPEQVPLRLT